MTGNAETCNKTCIRYSVQLELGDANDRSRTRIVVVDSKPTPKFGHEILALRLEPNGQWITEGTVDQSNKGNSLFIAAVHDKHSGKTFSDLDVRFPYEFSEAAELAGCIAEAYTMTQAVTNRYSH